MGKNVPKLRFKGFEGEWEEKKFKDIFKSFEYGMNSAAISFDGENKYIRITDIDENTNRYINQNIVSPDGILEDKFLVNENDILFARTGASVGKTYLYDKRDGKLYFAGFLIRGNVKSTSNSMFIFMATQTIEYKKWVKIMSMRSGQPGINSQEYASYKINVPSLDEQNKIANLLSKVDRYIELQEKKVSELEKYKKGMMQKIFSQKIRFRKDDGGEYPEWEEKRLSDVCTFFSGGTPSTKNTKYYNGDIPFIRSAEISLTKTELFISDAGLNNSSAKMIETGDLLYALYGATSGQVCISKINGAINQAILCIRSDKINLRYLEQLLTYYRDDILTTYLQGGQGNLSAAIIKNLSYLMPQIEEQEKISKFFYKIDTLIEKQSEKLRELKMWKKGLLQKMFV